MVTVWRHLDGEDAGPGVIGDGVGGVGDYISDRGGEKTMFAFSKGFNCDGSKQYIAMLVHTFNAMSMQLGTDISFYL